MKIKVLAIAPYPGLRELLESMSNEDPKIDMHIEVADLQNALPIVMGAKGRPYDVIMSRGGTSTLIRKHVSTPVVDIPVSGYDILRVLTLVKNVNSKVAIIGFPNVCRGVTEVSSLLDFEIPTYSVEEASEVPGALRQAFAHGVQMVLGDVVTVQTAEEMGYNGILITSGRESVLEAISQVRRMYEVVNKAQENERFYELLLEHHRTGVLAVDERGGIVYANASASTMLGYDQSVIRGMTLTGIDPQWARYVEESKNHGSDSAKKQSKRFQRRGMNIEIVVPTSEAAEGFSFLIYLYPREEDGASHVYTGYEFTDRMGTFAQIMGSSSSIRQVVSKARTLAETDSSIWIAGEPGTGKRLFAQAIHSAGKRSLDPFYVVPCSQLSEQDVGTLLFGSDLRAGLLYMDSIGSICLSHIEHVSTGMQHRLFDAMQAGVSARLIVTSMLPMKQLLKKGELDPAFAGLFLSSSLILPPLRDRLEDIDDIARVVIASYNSRHGKQIVGIKQDVLEEEIINKLWPGNIKQLLMVLDHMLSVTHGHYVGEKESKEGWQRVKEALQAEASSHTAVVNLSGTWDEIEQRILMEILQKEGMNQSKAAKRLGINRSTLWRKLKNALQF